MLQQRRVTLKDLIDAGLLRSDEELTCVPRQGEVYKAKLQSDGTILYDGQTFDSLSGWALHVAKNISRNGWRDVSARGRPLDDFRSQLQTSLGVNSTPRRRSRASEPKPAPAMAQVEQPRAVAVHSLPSERRETENDVRGVLLERVLRLTPPEFEKLVGAFLQAKGFSNVRVTGKSGDDGIDGECEMPFIKVKVAFQAKRYTTGNSVGIDPVQRLQGSMGRNFDRGIFITTSSFTSPARGWVEETHAPIALIDGDELVGQMVELGLGIKTVPVVRQELDQGFFTSLEKRP